nr:bile acid:sodium symporter [Leucobacter luti]
MGAVTGLGAPQLAPVLTASITPVLALLLFATFLGVPLARLGRAIRDTRFMAAVLGVNFVAAPLVAFALSRFVAEDAALLLGVLLVLLTPCVDYVIAFTGLAGGSRDRLLAATPLLMLLQLALLPGFLWLFAGPEATGRIEVWPFAEAFIWLILVPLCAAALVQWWSRASPIGQGVERATAGAMVPLMVVTLAVVVGSQIDAVGGHLARLLPLVPLYIAFAAVMVGVGVLAARAARLDVPGARAIVFSGVTRNSLVVLPLALALPPAFALAPLAVVTQTLVELVTLVALVRLVPRVLPARGPGTGTPHPALD